MFAEGAIDHVEVRTARRERVFAEAGEAGGDGDTSAPAISSQGALLPFE